ncbi:hypothetical protein QE400_003099 [Xanthomonas sacchari]|uniref:hypothetical protein n=1 Tax=Xanthomonas sacchari TaxID=56458 RepID=UPI0027808B1A|nr:hypothetical protein [Xanthomonas sacchari]MDQ1093686.1 hypothetical protein [Xanthomonas sacchari]
MLIALGIRNIAPSAQDPHHDVYTAHLDPDAAQPFCLGQSIGGGHAERGGSIHLALDELEAWPGEWRQHLRHAGCAWAIAPIDAAQRSGDLQGALAQRVAGAPQRRAT